MPERTMIHGTRMGSVAVIRNAFTSEVRFNPAYPKAVFIDCSDGRFTRSDEEFLRATFADAAADEVRFPGGAAVFHPLSAVSKNARELATAELDFLIQSHGTARVVLAGHEGCAHYRRQYPGLSPRETAKHQLGDLVIVGRGLHSRHRGILVRAFFKRGAAGEPIVYDEVLLDA